MSRENVERVRHGYEMLGTDWSSLGSDRLREVLAELLDPEVEWHDQGELPGATVHRGIDGVMHHMAAARVTLNYEGADVLELLDAGDSVVAVLRLHARGHASGALVEREAAYVYAFRGPKVARVMIFATRGEALKAVGLEE